MRTQAGDQEFDDEDGLYDEEEWDEENQTVIRAKWTFDGAETLLEAARMLREHADALEKMDKEGWYLEGKIEDDYGFCRRKPS